VSRLKQRVAKLESAGSGRIDVAAVMMERLAKVQAIAKRAKEDPEFAAQIARAAEERQAQLDRDFREGRLTGHELKLYLVKKHCREMRKAYEEEKACR
jgi:hypothetical protein